MSTIGMISAYSLAMDVEGISPEQRERITDAAIRIEIQRNERLEDCHIPTLYWPEGLAS